jgi:hypothetical protein
LDGGALILGGLISGANGFKGVPYCHENNSWRFLKFQNQPSQMVAIALLTSPFFRQTWLKDYGLLFWYTYFPRFF